MPEPVLFHCALDGWEYRRDPALTDEQAEYDIKSAMNAHRLMAMVYENVPAKAHRFRSGPMADSSTEPDSRSASSRPGHTP